MHAAIPYYVYIRYSNILSVPVKINLDTCVTKLLLAY